MHGLWFDTANTPRAYLSESVYPAYGTNCERIPYLWLPTGTTTNPLPHGLWNVISDYLPLDPEVWREFYCLEKLILTSDVIQDEVKLFQ